MKKMEFQVSKKWDWLIQLFGFKNAVNLYPPYLGAGIKIVEHSEDFSYLKVHLGFNVLNDNYVGVQFGGSLFSMCDPFYMFMFIKLLGPNYLVWDKSAEIDFIRPGETDCFAEFRINPDEVSIVKELVEKNKKTNWIKEVTVYDTNKKEIAKIKKTIYIRRQL